MRGGATTDRPPARTCAVRAVVLPLVWLTGFRLAVFRELSCDDSVIASSRGADLVCALAKLAVPEGSHLLRAGAASLLSLGCAADDL